MTRSIGIVSCALLLAQCAGAQVVAFENVNVLPMDRERVLERQTVVVRDGRIAAVGPAAKVLAPEEALKVDGRGKYLMPGFAEMHGHLPGADTPPELVERVLFLFVANGVTTVRGMLGGPEHLDLRNRIAEGGVLGPRLYVAGPAFSGAALTPEAAANMVREQKRAGFDLLKVLEGLTPEAYDAMAAAARQEGIPFAGHVPNEVGLFRALEAGQASVDHLDNYLDELVPEDSPIRKADPKTRGRDLGLHLDEGRIPALVRATVKAGVWIVPTMALWETFHSDESPESMAGRDEMKYVPREWVEQWKARKAAMLQNLNPEAGRRVIEVRKKVLRALNEGGAKIMFGTDAPQIFSVPGFSIHREFPIMLASGMTPYQVLESGTRRVAEYFDAEQDFGLVAAGRRADLILLEANPLEDLGNMSRRAGVMIRGQWLPEPEIQKRLAGAR